ncbi:hypothetical protein [Georgenia sp.]
MTKAFGAVTWPVRTGRLTLRPTTTDDADATWAFRRLECVDRRIAGEPAALEDCRAHFVNPDRLGTTVVVELDGPI